MKRSMISARSEGLSRGHGEWSRAKRAAAIAASMSALLPSGTVATCSPVEAFWMRNVRSEAGLTHWLPMKKLLRSRLISFSRESRASAGVGKFVIVDVGDADSGLGRSEEHTSELQSLMRISYAVFCLK